MECVDRSQERAGARLSARAAAVATRAARRNYGDCSAVAVLADHGSRASSSFALPVSLSFLKSAGRQWFPALSYGNIRAPTAWPGGPLPGTSIGATPT